MEILETVPIGGHLRVMPNEFNVEEMLTTTEFTIPVVIELPANNGSKPEKKTIKVTYNFDENVSKQWKDGKDIPVLDDDGKDTGKSEKVPFNLDEQLGLIVKNIDGVEAVGPDFWPKVRFRYRTAILEAILKDVYPNAKTVVG